MEFATFSTVGKIREINEDALGFYKKAGGEFIAVVCDGIGGQEGGEVASQTAVDTIIDEYKLAPEFRDLNSVEIQEWFQKTTDEILKLYKLTIEEDSKYLDMGTTLCVAIGVGNKVYIANIGDSRAYVLHNKKLIQITEDHTLANQLYKQGQLNKRQLATSPYNSVLYNVFGYQKNFVIDWFSAELIAGSYILLMSDGIYSELSNSEIVRIIMNSNSIESAVIGLCDAANLNGGRDNNTILIGEF